MVHRDDLNIHNFVVVRTFAQCSSPRLRSLVLFSCVLALLAMLLSSPATGAGSYQCDAVGSIARTNACAARWEAANVRAHVATNKMLVYSKSCLLQYATALDQLSARGLPSGRYQRHTGAWPCAARPTLADDGTLEQTCPGAVWSYANRGKNNCRPQVPQAVAARSAAPALLTTPQPAVPSRGRLDAAGQTKPGDTSDRRRDRVSPNENGRVRCAELRRLCRLH